MTAIDLLTPKGATRPRTDRSPTTTFHRIAGGQSPPLRSIRESRRSEPQVSTHSRLTLISEFKFSTRCHHARIERSDGFPALNQLPLAGIKHRLRLIQRHHPVNVSRPLPRTYARILLPHAVILSGVRRLPNAVEGPLHRLRWFDRWECFLHETMLD
jgi:hypothetical protein